jgi:hypothetical protein
MAMERETKKCEPVAELRPYQKTIARAYKRFASGRATVVFLSPTGSGMAAAGGKWPGFRLVMGATPCRDDRS